MAVAAPPSEPGPVPVPGVPAADAPKPARRAGRTVALIAVAAVLGVVGGTAVGYGVQAQREPTPLPALNQPDLAYPAKSLPKGQEPEPLSAAEDHQARTDGDLRKLLVPRPAGARPGESAPRDGWYDVSAYAARFKDESWMLEFLNENRVRRVALRTWDSGEDRRTIVQLVQFRASYTPGAVEHADSQRSYMADKEHAGNEGDPLKGSGNGRYYLYPVSKQAGFFDLYHARAVFQRGDVMVGITIYDTKKISKSDIRSLAEKQLERL